MAKTYLSSIKYEIRASYEVDGVVEKPDIVGAIFGQSEGLLGEDMDLKDLQQNGKIGRIEISVNKGKGKTSGEITIPSSLDRVKTSILAAAMETVEKVGPCEASVQIKNIVDTRKEKRAVITDRAQELLKKMMKFEGAESDELAETIKSNVRTGKVITYRGLTAGPEVPESKSIIVVEGRADVMKLLSYGINSAVAMDGSKISPAMVELCKEKEVTVLVDGDRGGTLNVEKLSQLTNVNFVAVAPDGKEVEELTQKEILQALKRRKEVEVAGGRPQRDSRDHIDSHGRDDRRSSYDRRDSRDSRGYGQSNDRRPSYGRDDRRGSFDRRDSRGTDSRDSYERREPRVVIPEDILALNKDMGKLKGSLKARLYDKDKKKIKDVAVKDLLEAVEKTRKKIDTVVFDGIVTKRLIDAAETKGINNVVGVKKGRVSSEKVKIYTL